jgi:anti-sigma-K factor RskA
MMIPDDRDELHALAGEFVLGVLEANEASEVAVALATNAELRHAVAFWEEQLHPLSGLTSPTEPPPGTWQAIEARITELAPKAVAPSFWNNLALWRWSTAGLAAAAAGLALWIALAPAPGPSFVAVLHSPQQDQAGWVATGGRYGLLVRAVAGATPPSDRAFELWAIPLGATRPRSLGVIPANGELKLAPPPPDLRDGATLAISIEPAGGSPTHQPTGPVVFVGTVQAV